MNILILFDFFLVNKKIDLKIEPTMYIVQCTFHQRDFQSDSKLIRSDVTFF